MTTPDWGSIESAYRIGKLSLRAMGTQYSISEGAIRKMAKNMAGYAVKKNGTQIYPRQNQFEVSSRAAHPSLLYRTISWQ
ncbi:Uncharacterised protein [Edwardsiella tarda]|nr:Uncharacterised protein [Edwardsiella tarda]